MEIEAKIKVEDLEPVAQKLKLLDVHPRREIFQRDFFFDRPDLSLKKSDCGLRLRRERYRNAVKNILCFKGPKAKHSPYKKRREIEVEVSDPNQAQQFLQALGYQLRLTFEKKRSEWRFENCLVCLDQLPVLGTYIEVEGPNESAIRGVLTRLMLSDAQTIRRGYASLLFQHADESHMPLPHDFCF